MNNTHYFDHNATTPLGESAWEAMSLCLREGYGNASSIHQFGQYARSLVEQSRRQVAELVGADEKEIVFTSGGTESDNLALFGMLDTVEGGQHVVSCRAEHPAVVNSCEELERRGVEITWLPVDQNGLINPDDVRRAMRPTTALVSVMLANNETGVIQPLAEIARIVAAAGALLHTDAVQAVGKIPIRVDELGVDLLSLTAHKFYGPKGAGALYVRKGVNLRKIQFGGRHERDQRPGTENVPGIVGLGAAAAEAAALLESDSKRVKALRDRLESLILENCPDSGVNGVDAPRLPNTSSMYFDRVSAEPMVIGLDLQGFAVSSGSACSSGATAPSHVLMEMGMSPERARASLRFSLGRATTGSSVDVLAEAAGAVVGRLRKLSPVA